MACFCKNPDGSPSQICLGTCMTQSYAEFNPVKTRSDKSIEDKLEYLLSVFLNKVDERINQLSKLVDDKYKQGFLDGFNAGRES